MWHGKFFSPVWTIWWLFRLQMSFSRRHTCLRCWKILRTELQRLSSDNLLLYVWHGGVLVVGVDGGDLDVQIKDVFGKVLQLLCKIAVETDWVEFCDGKVGIYWRNLVVRRGRLLQWAVIGTWAWVIVALTQSDIFSLYFTTYISIHIHIYSNKTSKLTTLEVDKNTW